MKSTTGYDVKKQNIFCLCFRLDFQFFENFNQKKIHFFEQFFDSNIFSISAIHSSTHNSWLCCCCGAVRTTALLSRLRLCCCTASTSWELTSLPERFERFRRWGTCCWFCRYITLWERLAWRRLLWRSIAASTSLKRRWASWLALGGARSIGWVGERLGRMNGWPGIGTVKCCCCCCWVGCEEDCCSWKCWLGEVWLLLPPVIASGDLCKVELYL